MKIVVIGDVHGRDTWKKQVEQEADMYIFLGDYFDSFDIDGSTQIENFKEILEFYNENPDKVVLLTGNHDLSYLEFDLACSGFQNNKAWEIHNLIRPLYEEKILKACKVVGDTIFVHAGIGREWVYNHGIDTEDLENSINTLFYKDLFAFGFQRPKERVYISGYGDNTWQSPMWIRPDSLIFIKLDGYKQVVGHTGQRELIFKNDIWFCDTQEFTDDCLNLNI